jgi:hypothetical protein
MKLIKSFQNISLLSTISILGITYTPAFAYQDPTNPTDLFKIIQKTILDNVTNLSTFILIPIGILVMVINIILILWSLISGEKGKVASKISSIIIGFIMVVIGMAISANKANLFN